VPPQVKGLRILNLVSQPSEEVPEFMMLFTSVVKPAITAVAAGAGKLKLIIQLADSFRAALLALEFHSVDVA
jgi:hypothetical protein